MPDVRRPGLPPAAPVASARWRRLDRPGDDTCSLWEIPGGWLLAGRATWRLDHGDALVSYQVEADTGWHSRRGLVEGKAGGRAVRLEVVRSPAAEWEVDGQRASGLDGSDDLDLGFTPATNLLAIRRLARAPDGRLAADAAWLDEDTWSFRRLPQWYERRSDLEWWYESPTTGYAALLTVTPDGFVSDYPGLWRLVP